MSISYQLFSSYIFLFFFSLTIFGPNQAIALYWRALPTPIINDICEGNGRFVATGPNGVIIWSTNGIDWYTALNPQSGYYKSLNGVCYGNGYFIAVGRYGVILRSSDGKQWTTCISQTTAELTSVYAAEGHYVAVGKDATILISTDGYNWEPVSYNETGVGFYELGDLGSVVFGSGAWVALESSNTTGVWSDDGINWYRIYVGASRDNDVIHDGERFVAASGGGSQSAISISTDGINWQKMSSPGSLKGAIAYGNGIYIAITVTGEILASEDLLIWTEVAKAQNIARLEFANNCFIGVGYNKSVISKDGLNWLVRSSPTFSTNATDCTWFKSQLYIVGSNGYLAAYNQELNIQTPLTSNTNSSLLAVANNDTCIVAVGSDGVAIRTIDGINWSPVNTNTTSHLYDLLYANNYFFAVGSNGTICRSPDGIVWNKLNSSVTNDLRNIASDGAQIIVSGWHHTLLISTDSQTWTTIDFSESENINNIAYGNGVFVAINNYGSLWYSEDGRNWESVPSGYVGWHNDILFGDDQFVLLAESGQIQTSIDGLNWQLEANEFGGEVKRMRRLTYNNNQFFCVGDGAIIMTSNKLPIDHVQIQLDMITPQELAISTSENIYGSIFDIEFSDDLINWVTISKDRTNTLDDYFHIHRLDNADSPQFYRIKHAE
ncbi:hypothetical protein [Rubellicoccus peritrichatus]|uniref:Photosynthesis system II assembly factor Ycf48/Hcf136-like domain-containing protein n=1 Tax=Rubellicoccus peritrichatus TaxID=3080537 RepID=A0AAQ3QTR2_9BACT|nr:hypothetical protein [Puniceicoccus sp. CR14]WOO39663.1 hypothetical protein RZN69_13650 [Puniceicoccus sp. CR14]